MKLSNETVTVLKNFSTINQNLVINPGKNISTMSAMKNIVAKATVTEEFPQAFAIYDLNEFLAALSLFEKPDLDFNDDFVVMTENNTALKYWYSDPSVVTTPTKEITMPDSSRHSLEPSQIPAEFSQLLAFLLFCLCVHPSKNFCLL